MIGLISGVGAVVFFEALKASTHLFLGTLAGYHVGAPAGEGTQTPSPHFIRPWAIPLVACLGALAAGALVYAVAPEAEGHGTDAAIAAVHHNPRGIRLRTVAVKIVASALTIGSGGSAGREGPTGQISAGFGSFLSRYFDLSPGDARIAVASGIGSGIGSIFGAPLAGAVLATEILYRDDFEVEALLPSFIASIVGYTVWGTFEGFGPLFGYVGNYHLMNADQLLWFALIGVLGGLVGLAYAKGFYGISDLFARLPVPKWLRPAIGGALVGGVALAIPQVLGTGYGWIQQGLGPQLLRIPLWVVLLIPLARIITTGFSVGSGGSGGIFGPGMVIGGFLGAGVWRLLDPIVPSLGHSPAPYVIVGMMACFGSIARAPLAIMLMVAEMTGSLSLVVPAMVAVGLATLIVRRNDDSIYRSQLRNRAEAPAHRLLSGMPLLSALLASQVMRVPRYVAHDDDDVGATLDALASHDLDAAPLVDADGRYLGVVQRDHLQTLDRTSELRHVDASDDGPASVLADRHLDAVLESLTSWSLKWMTVVDAERRVVGTVSISDIVDGYRRVTQENVASVSASNAVSGIVSVRVTDDSDLVGRALRAAKIPAGVVITSIDRGRDVVVPTGESVLVAGDRLTLIGDGNELRRFIEIAAPTREGS